MKNYINNFLNSKSEKRDTGKGVDYEYNYDGRCIKVFVPDNEVTEDTQTQLKNAVVKSIIHHYQKRVLGT